jgi:hypothetical protein
VFYTAFDVAPTLLFLQIAFAIGKAPMAKIMDVFGRAEGISVAAALYTLGGCRVTYTIVPFLQPAYATWVGRLHP